MRRDHGGRPLPPHGGGAGRGCAGAHDPDRRYGGQRRRRILGKPADAAEAAEFLLLLSGRRHRVTTAVCLHGGDRTASRVVETRVKVKRLSDDELSAYLRSGEWRGKAGGYAIQGLFGAFVPEIVGSYTNVVGLPLAETAALLTGMGYRVPYETAPI